MSRPTKKARVDGEENVSSNIAKDDGLSGIGKLMSCVICLFFFNGVESFNIMCLFCFVQMR